MKKETAKYEYLLLVWGGFWNPWNIEIHGETEPENGYIWFETEPDRAAYKDRLLAMSEILKREGRVDAVIAFREYEGFLTRQFITIRTIVLCQGEIHTVDNPLGYGWCSTGDQDEDLLKYIMEWKWDQCMQDELEGKEITRLKTFLVLEHFNDRNKKP
jgi:hypothetical protein